MLPKTTEEWSQANEMLKQLVVPTVMVETDLEKKNETLCGGVYSVFASSFGTKPNCSKASAKSNHKQHNRELKRLRKQKLSAQRALKAAQRERSIPTKAHASGVSLTHCSSISSSHAQTHYSHALSIRPNRHVHVRSLGRYYYTTDGPARRPAWSAVSGTRLRLTAVSCVDLGSSPCQDCRRRHIGYYPVR